MTEPRAFVAVPHRWKPVSLNRSKCAHCGIELDLTGPSASRVPTVCYEDFGRGMKRFVWRDFDALPTIPATIERRV